MGTFAFLLQFPSKRSWCFSAFRPTNASRPLILIAAAFFPHIILLLFRFPIKGIHISLIKSSRSVLFVVLKRIMIINRKFPFDIFLVEP